MVKSKKSKIYNIIFVVFILLLLIPQTRTPIQVFFNKAMTYVVNPSVIEASDREVVATYNWNLQDMSGDVFKFNSVEDKVVVINFWATWCPPCIAEMPDFQKLYDDYNTKVEFLFISNEAPEVISKFINEKDFTFKVYSPISEAPNTFDVSSIPRTFILNKKGEVVVDKTGAANWNGSDVRTLLDELLATE